jgi:hypothetical protein
MRFLHLLLLLLLAQASIVVSVDLTGQWVHTGTREVMNVTAAGAAPSSSSFAVVCTSANCGWRTANISQHPDLSLAITFDNGVKDSGSVDDAFTLVSWSSSTWARQAPPPPPVRRHVHLCPHSHLDPGTFSPLYYVIMCVGRVCVGAHKYTCTYACPYLRVIGRACVKVWSNAPARCPSLSPALTLLPLSFLSF